MQFYKNLLFPVLKQFDPEHAHERTLTVLEQAQRFSVGQVILREIAGKLPQRPLSLCGLTFPNVLGLAAGFDKDVRVAAGLGMLGFGHVEVGTLTPKPQCGNPKPRIFRLPEDEALINRMGFPNGGIETAVSRLGAAYAQAHEFILGVSLGKQKETPLADAAVDYITVMQAVYPFAHYLAINISSPNTPGLRDLQGGNYLDHLLHSCMHANKQLAVKHHIDQRPLFVKIAPDLTWAELDEILEAVHNNHIDGIIATNTTLSRSGLKSKQKDETGGLSGQPLTTRSTEIIRHIAQKTQGQLPIIGVGGIATAKDVQEKLDAGASLVQVYTSLIYEGPGIAGRILRDLYQ